MLIMDAQIPETSKIQILNGYLVMRIVQPSHIMVQYSDTIWLQFTQVK